MARRVAALDKVTSAMTVLETITLQKDMLLKVNELRIELEGFNKNLAHFKISAYEV